MKVIECDDEVSGIKFFFYFSLLIGVIIGFVYLVVSASEYLIINENKNLFDSDKTLICEKSMSKFSSSEILVSKNTSWRYTNNYFTKGDEVVQIINCEEWDK